MKAWLKIWTLRLCLIPIIPLAQADGWIVFGDSLCSHGWPELIIRYTDHKLQNHCQGGLQLVDWEIPAHLRRTFNYNKAIIALGNNDAYHGADIDLFTEVLYERIQTLEGKNFRVVCILPPDETILPAGDYRRVMEAVCPEVWDIETHPGEDGVHLTNWGDVWYAIQIAALL